MARSTRERYFMIGVAAAVGLWAVDRFAVSPYLEARQEVIDAHDKARDEKDKVDRLHRQARQMRRAWAQMRGVGIESAPSEMEGRVLHALRTWAQASGIAHLSLRPSRLNREHEFVQVLVHAGGSGSTAAVAKLLWSIESAAGMPLRIDELRLTPTKEGADDLQIELTVSTLCAVPKAEEKPGTGRQSVAAGPRVGEERP